MLVSIIMPIFNSEKYLSIAIDSVLNQTYSNFELLLIDDCSTDKSSVIAKEYSETDQRVKYYKNEYNIGICGTRNRGIDISSGDFLMFIDNDDELHENLLEENLQILLENKADVIKFGRILIDINDSGTILRTKKTHFFIDKPNLFFKEEKYDNYHQFKKNGLLMNVWNGLYKRELIVKNNIFFDETMKFGSEDAKFSYELFLVCNSIVINPKSYYIHYRRNISSTSRKFSLNKIDSLIKTSETESRIWNRLSKDTEKKLINNYRINYIKIIISNQLLHSNSNLSFNEKKEIIHQILNKQHLKILKYTGCNDSLLDNVFEYLVYKQKSMLLLRLYTLYKIKGGEKW